MRKLKIQGRKRGLTKKIFIATLPLLVMFLITEGICRWVAHRRFYTYGTGISIQGNSRWADHPVMIWTNRPGYMDYDGLVQYNEYGMRMQPGEGIRMPPKGPSDYWVFLFGGSTMAGKGSNPTGDYLKITGITTHDMAHSIGGYLQERLQKAKPDHNVRVFNAATVSHAVFQSRLNYECSRHLKPDFVVSMDGANDFFSGEGKGTAITDKMTLWENHLVNRYPYKQARFFMSRSAAIFFLGESLFFKTGIIRTASNSRADPEIMEYWLAQNPVINVIAPEFMKVREARVDEFYRDLMIFQKTLERDGVNHLLLIQPHLTLRDREKMTGKERALNNYYLARTEGRSPHHMQTLYQRIPEEVTASKHIFPMETFHHEDGWLFVDYCHFTEEANRRCADEIAKYILSEGNHQPFHYNP